MEILSIGIRWYHTSNLKSIAELSERIGAPVLLENKAGGKGKLIISYSSLDELDGILTRIH